MKKNPGRGWYFDKNTGEFEQISPEDWGIALEYVAAGYVQTSGKYRAVALFDRTNRPWKQLRDAELDPPTFAAFRQLKEEDAEHRLHQERESRRPRVIRICEIIRRLDDERVYELLLDCFTKYNSACETPYALEAGVPGAMYLGKTPEPIRGIQGRQCVLVSVDEATTFDAPTRPDLLVLCERPR